MSEEGTSLDTVVDINVTPMIDVLLSLLIIFMVAAPPSPKDKQPITIPEEQVAEQPDDPSATLLVDVKDDGTATLGETPLPAEYDGMVEIIKASEKAQADGRIAIRAGEQVAYGRVIEIMAAAREAGIPSVGLASERL